jgi:hypothetical protein
VGLGSGGGGGREAPPRSGWAGVYLGRATAKWEALGGKAAGGGRGDRGGPDPKTDSHGPSLLLL